MSALTDHAEAEIITHYFRTGSITKPTDLTVRLWTTMPDEAGAGGVEVSGGSYAPVSRAPGDANWAAPTAGNGQTSNVAEIAFPAPTANWGSVAGWTIRKNDGNDIVRHVYAQPKTVNSGDPAPKFNAGGLTVTFD